MTWDLLATEQSRETTLHVLDPTAGRDEEERQHGGMLWFGGFYPPLWQIPPA